MGIFKTYEAFKLFKDKNKYSEYENLSKPKNGEVDNAMRNKVLDVNNFNTWLSTEYQYGHDKGAPGIVGRIDKLSQSMVEDYFSYQGVECTYEETRDFENKIRDHWRKNR